MNIGRTGGNQARFTQKKAGFCYGRRITDAETLARRIATGTRDRRNTSTRYSDEEGPGRGRLRAGAPTELEAEAPSALLATERWGSSPKRMRTSEMAPSVRSRTRACRIPLRARTGGHWGTIWALLTRTGRRGLHGAR